jgi:hypothetical protein
MNLPQPDSGPDSNINSPYCINHQYTFNHVISRHSVHCQTKIYSMSVGYIGEMKGIVSQKLYNLIMVLLDR